MKEVGKLVSVLNRKKVSEPPIWLMRQAGRYLPEYRELRAKAGSFWTMCMTPKLACEITLQPIRRFGFDAAILFSDILVVPLALGVKVEIEEGIGPVLGAISTIAGLETNPEKWAATLAPVYEALGLVRAGLGGGTAMLGFAGAPWTLATYLAAGRGGDEQKAAKLWGYGRPAEFDALLDILSECVAFHLVRQLDAGADAVQIFDSWASGLPEYAFERWVVAPTKKIVARIRTTHPQAKIIGFPRAATLQGYERYARETGVDAISIDTAASPSWAAKTLGPTHVVQGNLDPIALIAGGAALTIGVERILDAMRETPFIFNLGHGILQETPIAHVEQLIAQVRAAR